MGIEKGYFDPMFWYVRRTASDPREARVLAVKLKGSTPVGTSAPPEHLLWRSTYQTMDRCGHDGRGDDVLRQDPVCRGGDVGGSSPPAAVMTVLTRATDDRGYQNFFHDRERTTFLSYQICCSKIVWAGNVTGIWDTGAIPLAPCAGGMQSLQYIKDGDYLNSETTASFSLQVRMTKGCW